ncbi:type III pantothenate kinase [Salegentibacter chungangensis]|uniref:Type III pantothenate kinase n=1 Tax=Salegentibacter chungangensis TaxID=1335724 RepID=A0ABW3NPB0_9FLAO
MNLVVDIGNSATKIAVFQSGELIDRTAFATKDFFKKFPVFFQNHPEIEQAILSSVVNEVPEIEKELQKHFELLILDQNTNLPFYNLYATPETLGKDRIALMAAAVGKYPSQNVLVIDAGTCITYDFKNDREEYLGGAISPGLEMRFRALNQFTSRLPLVRADEQEGLIGNSTEGSIRTGVVAGTTMEIEGFIDAYLSENKNLTVILTGGDTQILSMRVKNSIFANPNFLLEGLNCILEFNKTQ